MVDVVSKIVINKAKKEVADFTSDPDNTRKWYVNIKEVEWKTPRPLQIGSLIAFKAKFLGKELAYIYEVVEYDLDSKFVMKTSDGPFPMETTYEWRAVEEKITEMTLRNRGKPAGFKSIFAPFMSFAMKRANRKDLELLKSILESESPL